MILDWEEESLLRAIFVPCKFLTKFVGANNIKLVGWWPTTTTTATAIRRTSTLFKWSTLFDFCKCRSFDAVLWFLVPLCSFGSLLERFLLFSKISLKLKEIRLLFLIPLNWDCSIYIVRVLYVISMRDRSWEKNKKKLIRFGFLIEKFSWIFLILSTG